MTDKKKAMKAFQEVEDELQEKQIAELKKVIIRELIEMKEREKRDEEKSKKTNEW